MSRYCHYIYFLQAESAHFGLKVFTNFGLKVSGHSKLYQVFMHNFFVSKCLDILMLHIFLAREMNTIWLKGFDEFWSGGIATFWAQKIIQEKLTKFTRTFEL